MDVSGQLTFPALSEAISYRVEWTTNLAAPNWSSNAPGIPLIPGPGSGEITVSVGRAYASCFFRVVATLTNGPAMTVSSTFDSGAEGWTAVNYPFRTHDPNPTTALLPFDNANGNPAGSVRIGDIFSETGIAAPSTYLGQKLAYYGGSIVYDIFIRYTDGVDYPAVVLNGGGISLYYDAPTPPLNEWQRRTVPLTEAGWKVSTTHADASEIEFKQVLSELVGIYIYTEWNTGADDTNVDNFQMAPP